MVLFTLSVVSLCITCNCKLTSQLLWDNSGTLEYRSSSCPLFHKRKIILNMQDLQWSGQVSEERSQDMKLVGGLLFFRGIVNIHTLSPILPAYSHVHKWWPTFGIPNVNYEPTPIRDSTQSYDWPWTLVPHQNIGTSPQWLSSLSLHCPSHMPVHFETMQYDVYRDRLIHTTNRSPNCPTLPSDLVHPDLRI